MFWLAAREGAALAEPAGGVDLLGGFGPGVALLLGQAAPLGGDAGQVVADQHLIGGSGVGGDDERAADLAEAPALRHGGAAFTRLRDVEDLRNAAPELRGE